MKDKIPFYNIVNMFFVGAVFSMCLAILLRSYIPFDWIKENAELLSDWSVLISAVLLIAMYELGFIINRMGSIIIAPLYSHKKLKKFRIWPKENYGIDVSEIAQVNPRFQSMITEVNVMRTHILMYMLLSIISLFSPYKWMSLVFLGLVILFVLGGKKHNNKINKIRQRYYERKKKAEEQRKDMQNLLEYDGTEQK